MAARTPCLTVTLHCPHQPQPRACAQHTLAHFSLRKEEPGSLSQPWPRQPWPGPNSISKLNEFAEEPSELPTPLLAGWVVPGRATERAVAELGEPWAPSRVAGAPSK